MSKIFITGGSGLMGTNAVEFFINKGYEVLNFDRRAPQNKNHIPYWIQGDINNLKFYKETTHTFQPEYFLHFAARTDLLEEEDLKNGYKTNIEGVRNTIEVINECESLKRILFASSRLVCSIDYIPKDYDDYCPPNLYGESKMIGEKIVKSSEIKKEWAIFRPTSIWGPWFDSPYIIFFKTIKRNLYFHPGKHLPKKSFGYVKNSIYEIDKLFLAEKNLVDRKTFYLCDYPPIDVKKWATLIQQGLKSKKIPTYPVWALKTFAKAGDLFYKLGWSRVPITSIRLKNLIANMVYDTKELENICGPLPYSIEKGVEETLEWMRTHENRDKLALAKKE